MLALYRSGRQSEALAAYRDGRAALDELGLMPSRELRDLEEAILRHDESLVVAHGPKALDAVAASARITRRSDDGFSLIGRSEPMARLAALLGGTRDHDLHQLIVVSGEPGVGKTRLLREFASWAAANGHLVPFTSAEDDEILPYRPFTELVRAIVGSARGSDYISQLGPLAADLGLLVPELASSPAPPSTDPALTRTRLFDGVTRLVGIAATEQALVILIDDAHSMGRATGALIRSLLASWDDRRLSIVLAARDQPQPERSGLQDVLRQFEAEKLQLDGLTEADLDAWLESVHRATSGGPGWAGTAAELHARTGGVPLLVHAAMSEATGGVELGRERVRIENLVAERRSALTQEANDILNLAAIAGFDIEPKTIAAVSGLDTQAVRDDLREIVLARGLLVGGSRRDEYAWYHALVRDAVLKSVPVGAQTRWREALTAVLSGRGLALQAARHALEALRGQTRTALGTVVLGVDEAIGQLAFETGEDLCRRALALAGQQVDVDIAVALLGRLGLCMALSGQRPAADEVWREAAERARRARRPDLVAHVALATEQLGRAFTDTPLRWALLQEAMDASDLEPRLQIEVTCAWLEAAVMPRHSIADRKLATRVVRDARRHGDLDLLLRSLKTAHTVARATQRVGRELSSELCTLADRLGNPEWQAYARVLAFIDALIMLDRDSAEQHLERFISAAERATSPRMRWNAAFVPATWDMLHGNVESSNKHAYAAAELGRSYGMTDAALAMLIHGFFAAYHAGTLGEAADLIAQQAAEHPELSAFSAGTGLAFAAAGDHDAAARIRDRLFPAITKPGVDDTWSVAACLTAQLSFETSAPTTQCLPLRDALQAYPGHLAVLAGAVAECGPVKRYVGLLTASTDPVKAVALLKSAQSECHRFGASIWTDHIDQDISAVCHAMATPTG
jgi:hypothetical protein